jgi:hypothetical protein
MNQGAAGAAMANAPAGAVWTKTCLVLKRELGEATFGSWLGQASLRETGEDVCLVAATGMARDWIRRHAWRRIGELWAQNDPLGRTLDLKSRLEFEAPSLQPSLCRGGFGPRPGPSPIELRRRSSSDSPEAAPSPRTPSGPAGTLHLRHLRGRVRPTSSPIAVARRVASWADGHFNPVLFHGPYGFGKTHLLNALAWDAMRAAPEKRVVYLTAERFTTTFVKRDPGQADRGLQGRAAQRRPAADRRRPFRRRQDQHPGRAVPHPDRPRRRRPARGDDRRPLAHRTVGHGAAPALAPAGRPGLRHRAGRPRPAPGHPGAQACDAGRPGQIPAPRPVPRSCNSWPTVSPTASVSWKAR